MSLYRFLSALFIGFLHSILLTKKMEQETRSGNAFAAFSKDKPKKKTTPPTVKLATKNENKSFNKTKNIIEGAWADDVPDEEVVRPSKQKIIDEDGFELIPVKGKNRQILHQPPIEEPVTQSNETPDEEEDQESSASSFSEEEEEEEEPTSTPTPIPVTEKKPAKPELSKKEKKKLEEQELNKLFKELEHLNVDNEQKQKAEPEQTEKKDDIVIDDELLASSSATTKKKKKKPAKKKDNSTSASTTAPAAPKSQPAVKKNDPKMSAVDLALKEAKEREEKMKKKTKNKKLEFDH